MSRKRRSLLEATSTVETNVPPPTLKDILATMRPLVDDRAWLVGLGGGVGGRLTSIRPDYVPMPLTGRLSPGIEPMIQNLRPPGTSKSSTLITQAVKAAVADLRPSLDDIPRWRELMESLGPEMRRKMEEQYFGLGGLTGRERRIEKMKERERNVMDVAIGPYLERVRRTIGIALHECAHPKPDDKAEVIQDRLATALRLIWMHETATNYAYDFGIDGDSSTTLRELAEKVQASSEFRGYHRNRGDMFGNIVRRFQDEFNFMRQREFELRDTLEDPDSFEYDYDNNLVGLLVNACFDAALRLEANFEDRFYEDQDAGADHSELRSS